MDLTRVAIERNRITITVVALLIIGGVLAFQSIPKAQDPGFIIRTVLITTRFPGASPERIEQLVTDKIEKKAQEMPEIDSITSESRTGISIVYVNFKESYKIMRPIFDDLRRKIDTVVPDLPQGSMLPEINDEFGDVFGVGHSDSDADRVVEQRCRAWRCERCAAGEDLHSGRGPGLDEWRAGPRSVDARAVLGERRGRRPQHLLQALTDRDPAS